MTALGKCSQSVITSGPGGDLCLSLLEMGAASEARRGRVIGCNVEGTQE